MSVRTQGGVARPNCFVLGAAKCGTTSLYHMLRMHPRIFMSADKEPRFFDTDAYYARGLNRYLATHFRASGGYPVRGEATPFYLRDPGRVAPRMRQDLGEDLRFIAILRDPVQRAWSHYLHMKSLGAEPEDFEQALALEPERLRRQEGGWFGYFTDGLYATQLEGWFRYYPRERFLLLLTEDLRLRPADTARRIFEFLSVDPSVELAEVRRENTAAQARLGAVARLLNRPNTVTNAMKHLVPYEVRKRLRDRLNAWNRVPYGRPPSLDPRMARALRARYRSEVLALEDILERDLSAWLDSGEP